MSFQSVKAHLDATPLSDKVAVHFTKTCIVGANKGQVIKDYYNFPGLSEAMAYVTEIETNKDIPTIIGGCAYIVRFDSLSEAIAA